MRKRICVFALFCLILGLLTACSSGPSNSVMDRLSQMENYAFTAVGEITVLDGTDRSSEPSPQWYFMEGTRSAETGQFSAHIHYTDAAGRQLYDLSLLETGGNTYVGFVPLFQYLMDWEYAPHTPASVAGTFGENTYLLHPTLDLSDLLIDLPALFRSLDSGSVSALTVNNGVYTLRLTGDRLREADFNAIYRPFHLFAELGQLSGTFVLGELLVGRQMDDVRVELVFSHNEAADVITARLLLLRPESFMLAIDLTFREIPPSPIEAPEHTIGMTELEALLADYRAATEQDIIIQESGLEIVFDLPELHMVNHQLRTHLLEHFELQIGGHPFQISILANAANTATENAVFSVSSALSILYTTLDARSASQTLAPFVLMDLDVEHLDAGNFTRTPMRINAHDTAAVNALYFDDNLVGRTLHIYVLQIIPDTDQALFLGITVIMDNLTTRGLEVLDQLGFYIGVNFQVYLDMANQR